MCIHNCWAVHRFQSGFVRKAEHQCQLVDTAMVADKMVAVEMIVEDSTDSEQVGS